MTKLLRLFSDAFSGEQNFSLKVNLMTTDSYPTLDLKKDYKSALKKAFAKFREVLSEKGFLMATQERAKDKFEKYALEVPKVLVEYYGRQGIAVAEKQLTVQIMNSFN